MMKKIYLLSLMYLGISIENSAWSQYYFYNDKYYNTDWVVECGGSGGSMNSLTDLGGHKGIGKRFIKDLNWQNAQPCFSVHGLAMYRDAIALRLEMCFGNVESYDSILKEVGPSTFGRYERNLSFRSTIRDIHLVLEIHPFFLNAMMRTRHLIGPPISLRVQAIFRSTHRPGSMANGITCSHCTPKDRVLPNILRGKCTGSTSSTSLWEPG